MDFFAEASLTLCFVCVCRVLLILLVGYQTFLHTCLFVSYVCHMSFNRFWSTTPSARCALQPDVVKELVRTSPPASAIDLAGWLG